MAADLMSQMINSKVVQQDSENSVVLQTKEGQKRFEANIPSGEIDANQIAEQNNDT